VKARKAKPENVSDTLLYDHWKVEQCEEAVDGEILVCALIEHIQRHVVLTADQALAVALWILMAWTHQKVATHSPILMVTSAEASSGKSTLLGVLQFLVPRALSSVGISPAALYRSIEKWGPTLVIDEADTAFVQNEDLRAVVNSGWTRGSGVLRCVGDDNDPQLFSTFCSKAIGIKGKSLPDTTASRAIVIELKRKLYTELVKHFRHVDDEGLMRLRQQRLRWANDNAGTLEGATPEMLPNFHNRPAANWTLMLAIAERTSWKHLAWRAATTIENIKDTHTQNASIGIQLLEAIRQAFEESGTVEVTTKALIGRLTADPERPWADLKAGKAITPKQLGSTLRQYGIVSETVHPQGEPHAKGYKLERFRDAFQRYLGA
jgi:Protein of unknown function (DUF3631)